MGSNENRREFLAKAPVLAAGATALLGSAVPAMFAQSGERRDSVEKEYLDFRAEDGGRSWGLYYRPAGKNPKTAILLMHPNGNNAQHFLTRRLAARGYAVFGAVGRWNPDPMKAVPETCLLDIAAYIKFIKENYKVERIVLIGHSGGGGLFAFYQVQATTKPPGRYTSTPSGDPPDLNKYDMPAVDGLVCLAAHEGEGHIFNYRVDPSVVDENDPLATDWTLDMYDARNGFRPAPASSKYSPEFIARYKAAQLDRCKRLDAKAFEMIARQRRAQEQMKSPEFSRLDPKDQTIIRRTAFFEPYMTIYRVSAMLSMADLSIDPSDRLVGNGSDPERPNFQGEGGEASVMTARGYLCTWSLLNSRMITNDNLRKITVPTLVIGGTADLDELPGYIKGSYEASAAQDKNIAFIKGANHGYMPVEPAAGGKNTQDEAAKVIADWLLKRFPA